MLTYDAEGAKHNPIQLSGLTSADPEEIGRHIIGLYQNWAPAKGEPEEKQIGTLYGFELCIRQQREGVERDGLMHYNYHNNLYAESPLSGIKYLYNSGNPNVDNPKLAARYFISAIDRVIQLREKYEKELDTSNKELPVLRAIMEKPFEKDAELAELKAEAQRLQEKIAGTIRDNQLQVVETKDEAITEEADEDNVLTLNTEQKPDEPRRAAGR